MEAVIGFFKSAATVVIDFFKSLTPYEWVIVGAVALALILVIVVICVNVSKSKKKKAAKRAAEQAVVEEQPAVVVEEPSPAQEPVVEQAVEQAPVEEQAVVEEQPAEETPVEVVEEQPAEEAVVEEVVEETPVEEPAAEEQPTEEAPVEKAAKPAQKVYHVSKRKTDGKWQVKASKGAKAIKLFATQLAAIDFAKKLAINQEARVIIHKEDGSFRKLTYKK